MNIVRPFSTQDLIAYSKNWVWFLIWGMVLLILGLFAVSAATFTTLLTVVALGFILLVCGTVILVDTFTFWWRRGHGFLLHLIMGIIYLTAAAMIICNPVASSISLTLLIGACLVFVGIFRITYAMSLQLLMWGWSLVNGILTLVLGILILASWPVSGLFIIGMFLGIDLIFCGWAYIMTAFAARNFAQTY
jgi:uncharacterized membrane protein HdeD (DUF308 family)